MQPLPADSIIYQARLTNWKDAATKLLDAAGLFERIQSHNKILLKPNLVTNDPPPITTPPELIEAIILYLWQKGCKSEIIVADGTAMPSLSTKEVFRQLGYNRLSKDYGVILKDLDTEPLMLKKNPACKRWPEIYLPKIVFESFLISVPVLKAHSFSGVTLTMKNMMGLPPSKHYQRGGSWKKSAFHHRIEEAIFDLNRHRSPDFTMMDATVGMKDAHLWGETLKPPPNLLLASYDPVAIDAYGAKILSRNWKDIGHIRKADGILGKIEGLSLVEL
ncbi:MAG: DUF362 domain-containing protein [Deltaproteobacteria bacterium]|nr:DUF362 domain-containing protein [Deltaproteobacteria bacterium]